MNAVATYAAQIAFAMSRAIEGWMFALVATEAEAIDLGGVSE
jgi:hypothetical protein